MKNPVGGGKILLTALGILGLSASLAFSQLPKTVTLKTFYDTTATSLKADLVKVVSIAEVPGLPKHLYVLDMKGKLWGIFPNAAGYSGMQWYNYAGTAYTKKLLADFSAVTHYSAEGEAGAYSVCFHPLYAQNRKFYIYYYKNDPAWAASLPKYYTGSQGGITTPYNGEDPFGNPAGTVTLDEYQVDSLDVSKVTKLREVFKWHQQPAVGGGTAKFGPDGYLYLTSGSYDGSGRDLHNYLNKVFRIDVTSAPPAGAAYVIPPDNPYANAGDTAIRKEIWARGFRNPWTTAFDWDTGDMWLGDVDQDHHEEINLIVKDGNYGWDRGGDLNNMGDGNYGQLGPGWGFSGPCATAAAPYHKPGGDSCKYYTDPAYTAPRIGAHALQCVIVGTVFRGAATSPFYGYLLGSDNTLDTIWAIKKGDAAPQSVGHPTQFGNSVGHRGIGAMSSGIGGIVYVAALDWYDPANRTYRGTSQYFEVFQLASPDLQLKSYAEVTAIEKQNMAKLNRLKGPRLIVDLGFALKHANYDKLYDLGGKLTSARRGAGVYFVKPVSPVTRP